jgi:hypothetical protein
LYFHGSLTRGYILRPFQGQSQASYQNMIRGS